MASGKVLVGRSPLAAQVDQGSVPVALVGVAVAAREVVEVRPGVVGMQVPVGLALVLRESAGVQAPPLVVADRMLLAVVGVEPAVREAVEAQSAPVAVLVRVPPVEVRLAPGVSERVLVEVQAVAVVVPVSVLLPVAGLALRV